MGISTTIILSKVHSNMCEDSVKLVSHSSPDKSGDEWLTSDKIVCD
ncbi:MAG: hypothetical protein HC763_22645 [Hydrococcus sp. CRU_1_1]|nr:hypothetical protein [Hydrococcus sp. CRU_1_1]